MLKELQEKIKLEIERMQNALVDIIKKIINEEKIYANVTEDLSEITLFIIREKREDRRLMQDEFIFVLKQLEDGKVSKVLDFDSNVVLFTGNKIAGTYSVSSRMELEVAQVIFGAMEKFREEELAKEAAPAE